MFKVIVEGKGVVLNNQTCIEDVVVRLGYDYVLTDKKRNKLYAWGHSGEGTEFNLQLRPHRLDEGGDEFYQIKVERI